MYINLQTILNGRYVIGLARLVGRILPPRLGYPAADWIADQIAGLRHSKVVRGVRANQWVVRGEVLAGEDLDRAVRETIRQSARSIYELYRFTQHPEEAQELIVLDAAAQRLVERPEFERHGLVVASLHLGNFDFILHRLSMQGFKALVLTVPDPQGARRIEFEMRRKAGANLLPASFGTFRRAIRHLQRGGLVATGIDRPIRRPEIRPLFFGRPASLPLHHIFIALKARVPLIVVTATRRPDGKNYVTSSDVIAMERHPDRETEMRRNAEKVLAAAERYIREAPEQWSVSLPVWPEVVGRVP
jgi:lauroyl/myristoyl acyltransferase